MDDRARSPVRWCRCSLLLVFAGAVAVAGGASARQQEPAPAMPGGEASRGQQEPGAEPESDGQQEPGVRLTERDSVGQDGSRVRVGDSQLIFNSIFEFSDSVNDLFVWAWMPTISGDIGDNAFLGGQKVAISPQARIGGDTYLFAQTGQIDGRIGGDLYAFVAEMTVGPTGVVEGAVFGSSGVLTVEGEIAGPLRYAGGRVTINGTLQGDVHLEAGELVIGPEAVIVGELRYESPREAEIDPGARIQGDVVYFPPQTDEDEEDEQEGEGRFGFSVWGLLWDAWWLLSSFLVGALALALGGDAARRPAERLVREPALGLGFGFVVAVVFPAAAILAILMLVTIPLGLIVLALYCAASYLARLVAAQAVGERVLHLLRGGRQSSAYAQLAIGLVLFYLLTQIPYVGFLIWLGAIVAGLGGIFLATRRPPTEAATRSIAPVAG